MLLGDREIAKESIVKDNLALQVKDKKARQAVRLLNIKRWEKCRY